MFLLLYKSSVKFLVEYQQSTKLKNLKWKQKKITDREKLEEYIHSYGFIVKDVDSSDGFGHDYDGY